MAPRMVTSFGEVFDNVKKYQDVLRDRDNEEMRRRVAMVWSWYAVQDERSGQWKFAPSKFVGYHDPSAKRYLAETGPEGDFDGRITERVLRQWFATPQKDSKLQRELAEALHSFLAGFGKAPGARARINVPKENIEARNQTAPNENNYLTRINFDPAVCGGRPCIKGTRMRVADIVEALAHGATQEQLLADFDYLTAEDIAAALLYAARATEHRVVRTA
jgi:uncharacterized protein (DUF433 family)